MNFNGYKRIIFTVSCVFVYAGAVNYGVFDFIPAIPFLIVVLYAAYKWGKNYFFSTVALLLLVIPLYLLKKNHGELFHPKLGAKYTFSSDVCLIQFADTTQTHVTVVEISDKSPCDILGLNGAKKFQVFSKGEILEIKKISVSNADFGEHYVIHSETALGELELASNNLAIWLDGKPVTQSDLRRTIFFLPSLLMYWPMAPVMLPTLFNK